MANWILPPQLSPSERLELDQHNQELLEQFGFSAVFSELLWRRGIKDTEVIASLLKPEFSSVVAASEQLSDMNAATELMLEAMRKRWPIIIYGDYDVDGVSATSLLWRFLYRELNAQAKPFIPSRMKDGYGLNRERLEELIAENNNEEQLIITVDCGIRDAELIAEVKAAHPQVRIIVTDHHQLREDAKLPPAEAIVHPQHPSSEISQREICAASVAWLFVTALKKKLGLKVDASGLELAALATMCDVMPLTGINRDIVKLGLAQFKDSDNIGLKALCQIAGVDLAQISTYHLGYVLGPRINAAGRIAEAITAVRLLCTNNQDHANELAAELNNLNTRRQQLTETALNQVAELASAQLEDGLIFLHNENWAEGIVGLVAGKVHEKYNLPVLAATKTSEGHWVGSARSNKQVDITELISTGGELLLRFGGHAQAAGFSVEDADLATLSKLLKKNLAASYNTQEFQKEHRVDMQLGIADVNLKLIRELELLEPFGNANPTPQFIFPAVSFSSLRKFGKDQQHYSLKSGVGDQDAPEFIWFNCEQKDLAPQKTYDFLGALGYNQWRNKISLQVRVKACR